MRADSEACLVVSLRRGNRLRLGFCFDSACQLCPCLCTELSPCWLPCCFPGRALCLDPSTWVRTAGRGVCRAGICWGLRCARCCYLPLCCCWASLQVEQGVRGLLTDCYTPVNSTLVRQSQ